MSVKPSLSSFAPTNCSQDQTTATLKKSRPKEEPKQEKLEQQVNVDKKISPINQPVISLDLQPSETMSSSTQAVTSDYLPPTKIKRQYRCKRCEYATVNPRCFLKHRIDTHADRIRIVECPLCVYACQFRQKLNRHMRLVHHRLPHQIPQIINSIDNRANQMNSLNDNPHDMPSNSRSRPRRQQRQRQQSQQENIMSLFAAYLQMISLNNLLPLTPDISAFVSQLTPVLNEHDDEEPVDLSFSTEVKQLIKLLGSQKT